MSFYFAPAFVVILMGFRRRGRRVRGLVLLTGVTGSIIMLTYMSTQAQTTEYNIYWYVNDHLDTPQKLVDESGNIVNETYLTPFGEVALESETVRNNFRFPGQYHDRESMLYYNWNRYYIPSVGRYSSVDFLLYRQNFCSFILLSNLSLTHVYTYTENNPEHFFDLKGLESNCDDCKSGRWWGIIGGIELQIPGPGGSLQCGFLRCTSNFSKKLRICITCFLRGLALSNPNKYVGPVGAQLNSQIIVCGKAFNVNDLRGSSSGVGVNVPTNSDDEKMIGIGGIGASLDISPSGAFCVSGGVGVGLTWASGSYRVCETDVMEY